MDPGLGHRCSHHRRRREIASYLHAIIDVAPVAVFDLDESFRVRSLWNRTAERFFGYSAVEVVGLRPPVIGDELQARIREWEDSGAGPGPLLFEVELARRGGSTFPATVAAASIPSPHGVMVVIVSDISALSRVRTIAMVHEQLYTTQNLATIDLAAYLRSLSKDVDATYGREKHLRVRLDLGGVSIGVDRAIPLGLIVNELLVNAYRHAFPTGGSGTISVATRRTGDTVTVVVQDDGVGLTQTSPTGSPTLGLTLVSILAGQIGATIRTDGSAGTRYTVEASLR
ncbi:MAG: ATP-binding protein [Spirochaetales bacterium]